MQKLKAVIFDIDGTLANTVPLCIQAFRQALEPQLHRPLSDEEIKAAFGPDEEGTIASFNPPDVKNATNNFMRYYEALHEEMCPEPFNGIKDLLRTLKSNGVRLAIATGKGKDCSLLSLQRFDILLYFGIIENGAREGSRKPQAIQQIVNAFGVQKEETLYVGDAPGDIKESRKAGIHVVAAAWAGSADKKKLEEEHPDGIFDSVKDFARWLYEKV
ncbi:HAD family hydrolase [Ilyomonas limi]|uniref:phosphoglycolate phosphatase n=1 Tax=Ilyomonas limi TaxID=2575867 RepID=A0A4U3KWI6_9BACT|nr:HAD family hydrolase [Ilyomonas limi]TKK66941.1 HAD family hydrolase [Ilyomonas limi]